MQSHKHAELIKKWAAGFEVERLQNGEWIDDFFHPGWILIYFVSKNSIGIVMHNPPQITLSILDSPR